MPLAVSVRRARRGEESIMSPRQPNVLLRLCLAFFKVISLIYADADVETIGAVGAGQGRRCEARLHRVTLRSPSLVAKGQPGDVDPAVVAADENRSFQLTGAPRLSHTAGGCKQTSDEQSTTSRAFFLAIARISGVKTDRRALTQKGSGSGRGCLCVRVSLRACEAERESRHFKIHTRHMAVAVREEVGVRQKHLRAGNARCKGTT